MLMMYTFTSVPSSGDQRDVEMNCVLAGVHMVFSMGCCLYVCSIMSMCIYGCIYVYSVCSVY